MIKHVDVETLLHFAEGEAEAEVEAHVRECPKCRDLAAVVGLELEPPREESTFSVGVYEDIRLYGKGGMGEVFVATDRRLQRRVILKMPPRTDDSVRHLKLAARLEHERTVLARLNHPAIPPVLEGGQLGEDLEPFFAMPIAGIETLTKAVARSEDLGARIALLPSMISVAEGVAYAHRGGVIHRDIKPDHVLLGSEGEARLIDWGLAKVLDEGRLLDDVAVGEDRRGDLLATVQGLYTEGYSPPEQRGNAPAAKHFDVYALGATLFFLVTGQHPTRPQPPRSAFPKGCPRDLVKIVRKAMHADPSERYSDAGELSQVLKTFQAGRLVHPSPAQVIEDWFRRHAVALLAIVAVLVVAMVAAGWARHRDALERANDQYLGQLDRVRRDAQTSATAERELATMYARLTEDFQNLEQTSTATIAVLSRRLGAIREQHDRLNRIVARQSEERQHLERQRTVANAQLGRAGAMVLELQAQVKRWEAETQRALEQLERSEQARSRGQQRLARALRRIETLQTRRAPAPSEDEAKARRERLNRRHERTIDPTRQRRPAEPPLGPFGYQTLLPEIGRGPGMPRITQMR